MNDERFDDFWRPERDSPARSPADGHAPVEFTVFDVLSRSWQILRSDAFRIAGTVWGAFGLLFWSALLLAVMLGPPKNAPEPSVFFLIAQIGFAVFAMTVTAGLHLFVLNVASGRKYAFSDLFRCRRILGTVVLANVLFVLANYAVILPAAIGTAVLGEAIGPNALIVGIVVGVPAYAFVSLSLTQYQFLIVERETTAMQSLKLSWKIMRGHRFEFLFLIAVTACINVFGLLAFGVGLLITIPLVLVSLAVFYLAVTGQSVADPLGFERPKSADD